jgi:hypothetical protein
VTGGYANPVKKIDFPGLSSGADDPIWVVIKNPKVLPPKFLQGALSDAADSGAIGEDEPAGDDTAAAKLSASRTSAAMEAGKRTAAKLIIAWRVYDTDTFPEFDTLTGEQVPGTGQTLLPGPAAGDGVPPELFDRVPMQITMEIMNEVGAALNPQPAPAGDNTPKISSSSPSPSTTEPGAEDQSPPS